MYKEKIICLIATHLSEENCESIYNKVQSFLLARSALEQDCNYLALANSAGWDESKHPRADDGKFTHGQFKSQTQRRQMIKDIDDAKENYSRRKEAMREKTYKNLLGMPTVSPRKLDEDEAKEYENLTRRIEMLEAHKKGLEQDIRTADNENTPQNHKKHSKMAKEYRENDDEIDALQEYYHTSEGEVKFTDDEQGKSDAKKYRKLLRRQQELTKRINWDLVDDEEDSDGKKK